MGGFGSGRPSGSGRNTVEACRSIDVNRLHREGCLRAGWYGRLAMEARRRERRLDQSARRDDRLHLSYRVRIGGGEWEDVAETVRIVRVPCRLGGARPYFICPGVVNGIACGRRVAKLHGPGRYFLCRHCYRLATRARARANGTGRCGAPTRSDSASAAIPAWPRHFHRSRKACGGGPTSGYASRRSRPRRSPTKPLRAASERLLARSDKPKRKRTFWS